MYLHNRPRIIDSFLSIFFYQLTAEVYFVFDFLCSEKGAKKNFNSYRHDVCILPHKLAIIVSYIHTCSIEILQRDIVLYLGFEYNEY